MKKYQFGTVNLVKDKGKEVKPPKYRPAPEPYSQEQRVAYVEWLKRNGG